MVSFASLRRFHMVNVQSYGAFWKGTTMCLNASCTVDSFLIVKYTKERFQVAYSNRKFKMTGYYRILLQCVRLSKALDETYMTRQYVRCYLGIRTL